MASASYICSTQLVFQELIDIIIQSLSRDISSLLSLCLASRHSAHITQKYLYSRICLNFNSDVLQKFQLGSNRAAQWLATVTSNPSLAHHLECIEVELVDESFWPLLLPVLRTMNGLTNMSLFNPPTSCFRELWECPFRLEQFTLVTRGLIQEEGLIKFLGEQTEIACITLAGDWTESQETRLSISSAACHSLRLFQGERTGIEVFLRDRPNVRWVYWISSPLHEGSTLPPSLDFGHILARLTILILFAPAEQWSPHRPPLSHISQHLTALRILAITGEYYKDELCEVSRLPRLVGFFLTGSHDYQRPPEPVEAGLANLWFRRSWSLRAVHFFIGTSIEDDSTPTVKFRVWKRGAVNAILLQYNGEWDPERFCDELDISPNSLAEITEEGIPQMKS
ncbi:hypothetical protein P691DRAFT_762990 [Macrolepiota fuliginosa MF-IS2]|uniref:Uncharacterized protein n=1 Tax=Macrolepiota fuliginosa MF-IS2 TaxID=1400762 RepID=A0A9P6BZ18_9AGAR|nr:hypothetical protein P691DRAFT_762990 [Macrolepiota fuliginosa MF-IS2]